MDFRPEQLQISDNLRDLASRIRNAGDADTVDHDRQLVLIYGKDHNLICD